MKDPNLPNRTRPSSDTHKPGINVQKYNAFGKRDRSDPEAVVTVVEFGKTETEDLMGRVVSLLGQHYYLRRRTEAEQPEYMDYHRTSVVVSKKEK